MVFTIGADPEIFVKKNGKGISIHETSLPGTKSEPFKTKYGAVQRDGTAAEFNIDPAPLNDFYRFNQNIVRTVHDLKDLTGQPVTLAKKTAVMEFSEEYMNDLPDEVKELGCDPDFNAYTLEPNPRPNGEIPFRCAGGHIHVGWGADIPIDNPEHIGICASFVKMLDATVGMYMTYIDRDPRRRELYGKAGAFRPKPYGVEYRTPSNAWIWNVHRRLLLHYFLKQAINKMTSQYDPEQVIGLTSDEIVEAINSGNFERAERVIERFLMPSRGEVRGAWDRVKGEIAKEVARGQN